MIVTAALPASSLPAAAPPNLRKSLSLIADSLPAPTTISREALRPSGARISSVEPLFPLNWLVSAARLTTSADVPSTLRVAAPNFSESSQKTTRTPRGAVENGTKPTLTASDMGKSSKNSGLSLGREPAGRCFGCSLRLLLHIRGEHGPGTMACQPLRCQASPWLISHITRIINHIPRVPRRSHFVDGSKGW